MDYLGISPTTPDASSQVYPTTDMGELEAYQAMTGAASTNTMGARTWSKPSIPDSMSQARGPIGSATGRGIVVSFFIYTKTWRLQGTQGIDEHMINVHYYDYCYY